MSLSYAPDQAALIGSPTNITLFSQRDVSLAIPINFLNGPSVSVTAACFSHSVYEAEAAAKCISNLLAIEFKRLYLDVYWDTQQLAWSLCPAELPVPAESIQPTFSTSTSRTSSEPAGTVQSKQSAEAPSVIAVDEGQLSQSLQRRQDAGASSTVVSSSVTNPTVSPTVIPNAKPSGLDPGFQIYQIGPYSCNRNANLSTFINVLEQYLHATDDTLHVSFKSLLFNLHVASPAERPTQPAERPAEAQLPNSNNLIGNILAANLSSYIYYPGLLLSQRADLNTSWSAAPSADIPDPNYFSNITRTGTASKSPDGWPSEGFLEFFKMYRLILGYGTRDPQLSGYNYDDDQRYLFPPGFLNSDVSTTVSSDGLVTSACIYDPSSSSVATSNSSWAVTSVGADDVSTSALTSAEAGRNLTYNAAFTLTQCGITPILNTSLSNTTADVDPKPYLAYSLSNVWSWAPSQPLNDSDATSHDFPGMSDDAYPASDFRCAYFNGSSAVGPAEGRWHVTFCQNQLHAACRDVVNPYIWSISDGRGRYDDVSDNCPRNSTFVVPRTPLENRHLLAAVQSFFSDPSRSRDDDDDDGNGMVWLDFNSIDVETCWVSGADSQCPYTNRQEQNEGQVVVPIVAAFAIITLALLTILAKCGSNRRKSRKRRRVRDGWEYEGVPN